MRALLRSLLAVVPLVVLLAAPGAAKAQELNDCGCYAEPNGSCKCTRPSKCGCPGECEPVGCEAKRQRQAERDARAEMKRIQARERKKAADAAKASRKNKTQSKKPAKGKATQDAAARALDELEKEKAESSAPAESAR